MAAKKKPTRRPRGEGTVYADRGGFVAEVDAGNGKRYRHRAATREDAERQRVALLAAVATKSKPPSPTSVGAWLDEWIGRQRKLAYVQERTILGYESIIRDHLKPRLGAIRLTDLGTSHVQGAIAAMQDDGLQPNTVRNIRNCLGAAMRSAAQQGHTSSSPVPSTSVRGRAGTVGTIAVKHLTAEQIDEIFECVGKDMKLNLAVNLTLTLGLRQQELLGLDWSDFDATAQTLRIRQAVTRGYEGLTLGPPKTARSRRVVRLPTHLAYYLNYWKRSSGPIFDGKRSTRWSATDLTRRWKKALADGGREPLEWRALRHIAISRMIEKGMDVVQVSRIAGHSTAATTLRFYADAAPVISADEADARSLDPGLSARLRLPDTPTINPQPIDPHDLREHISRL